VRRLIPPSSSSSPGNFNSSRSNSICLARASFSNEQQQTLQRDFRPAGAVFERNAGGFVVKETDVTEQSYYLKPNVKAEPLVSRWGAWPLLVAPAQGAMTVANIQVKVMKSFVMAPQIHAEAIKNPAMRGGPFLDVAPARVAEVRALLDRTLKEQGHLLAFADAVKALNQMLVNEAKGYCIEDLYEKVPAALKGYVELVYDLNNFPSARFIEGLLYRSPYYDPTRQAFCLSATDSDHRPFGLSTPRLDEPEMLIFDLPFASAAFDELCAMRFTPRPLAEIASALALDAEQTAKLARFLTTDPPSRRAAKFDGEGVRVRYVNHACLLVESRDTTIMTDPIVGYDYPSDLARYTYLDMPERIDYALISHGHGDHLLFETLLQLRHKIGTVVVPKGGAGTLEDPSLKLMLRSVGFKNVVELDELETIEVPGGSITGLPFLGEHADLNIRSKTAHLIELAGRRILCAADSRNVAGELYERLREVTGDIETLFLGMECDGAPLTWSYGQLCTRPLAREMDQSRRLTGSDYVRGMDIVLRLNCRRAYVYAMGQEPWLNYITSIVYTDESKPIIESNRLIEACRSRGIEAARLYGASEIAL
jgi:L-ascorbate metabolism protein UlaG (beta-lactamase superfamily)